MLFTTQWTVSFADNSAKISLVVQTVRDALAAVQTEPKTYAS